MPHFDKQNLILELLDLATFTRSLLTSYCATFVEQRTK